MGDGSEITSGKCPVCKAILSPVGKCPNSWQRSHDEPSRDDKSQQCECGLVKAEDCVSTEEYCQHPAIRSRDDKPQEYVYENGIIRDKAGRSMSVAELVEVANRESYWADQHEADKAKLLSSCSTNTQADGLLPCPCCGGEAKIKSIPATEGDPNGGAEYVECQKCLLCTRLLFPLKDCVRRELSEIWNARTRHINSF